MKVLHLNAADIEGGAARASTRLLQGLTDLGVDARLHVQRKFSALSHVDGPRSLPEKAMSVVRPTIEQYLFGITPGNVHGPFSTAFLPDGLSALVSGMSPDIVHLHWVARMMRLESLGHFNVPIVWTMHDSWAFTGGCYLPGNCIRYREECGECPVLGSSRQDDLSNRIWQRKLKAWDRVNLTVVAPSRWMASCARASSLFRNVRIEIIPNGLDTNRFRPLDRNTARTMLSLPVNKKIILFGAKGATSDRNKGFHLLAEALHMVTSRIAHPDSVELLIFGSTEPSTPPDLGFKTHYLGWQNDDTLATLYAAADVFVLPSLQESLGYTVMEAMACGTPCVAFNQGGVPDLIDHLHNGYLARPYEPSDLAQGVVWVLEDNDRRKELSSAARDKITATCALENVTEKHLMLYHSISNT